MTAEEILNNTELTNEQDISLHDLSKEGFMVAPLSNRNREFLANYGLMNFLVADDMQTWIFNYQDPQIKFPSFIFTSDTEEKVFV